MPYNTRRKSLSLPSLGIQLPNASRAHRPSAPKASPPQTSPPTKRIKRSHNSSSSPPASPSRAQASSTKNVTFAERPKSAGRMVYEHTPPPSPRPSTHTKIDTEGINDDIVIGVIEQLEKTGNRPHLIRELATVLSTTNTSVTGSANPGALLSSRLSTYMKRPAWSASSPCPLDKELTTVHPRKVYYFLNTLPKQDIPADSSDLIDASASVKGGKRIISPSISNASVDGDPEAAEERKREALSPSPEIDLSMHDMASNTQDSHPEFIAPGTPAGTSFSGRSSLSRNGAPQSQPDNAMSHSHRNVSPPLEGDEKEFTQTASSVRLRGMSLDQSMRPLAEEINEMVVEESEEDRNRQNREAVEALFGPHNQPAGGMPLMSSPMVKAASAPVPTSPAFVKRQTTDVEMPEPVSILGNRADGMIWDTSEVEDIQVEDLDDLFMAY